MWGGEIPANERILYDTLAVAESKGLLFHELLLKLQTIREEFGSDAEMWELAMQAEILEQRAEKRRDDSRKK